MVVDQLMVKWPEFESYRNGLLTNLIELTKHKVKRSHIQNSDPVDFHIKGLGNLVRNKV